MNKIFNFTIFMILISICESISYRRSDFTERCPLVKPMRNFQIEKMMGSWNIIEYYSSTDETSEYHCMRSELKITDDMEITMNFTYAYINDNDNDFLNGNITLKVLNLNDWSHWVHSEDVYEGIYNTYVIDTDYENWALMMNCAEKIKNPRYLSALLMSRTKSLGHNVKVFLREKLPKYKIDLAYMFPIKHDQCEKLNPSFNMKYYYDHVLLKKLNEDAMKTVQSLLSSRLTSKVEQIRNMRTSQITRYALRLNYSQIASEVNGSGVRKIITKSDNATRSAALLAVLGLSLSGFSAKQLMAKSARKF